MKLLFLLLIVAVLMNESIGYKTDDKIPLYLGKTGPYYNIYESYDYLTLPFCPAKLKADSPFLPYLTSDKLIESDYEINFNKNIVKTILCKRKMSSEDLTKLSFVINHFYYYEFVIEKFILRGFIGNIQGEGFAIASHSSHLWNHLHFVIETYNDDITFAFINIEKSSAIRLDSIKANDEVEFSYSISWQKSPELREISWKRMKQSTFFAGAHNINWDTFLNPFLFPFLLSILASLFLLRVLQRDFARYNRNNSSTSIINTPINAASNANSTYRDELEDDNNDYGWKLLSGDVFRPPGNLPFFSASIGVGGQVLLLCFLYLLFFYILQLIDFQWFFTFCIISYYLTQFLSGFLSSKIYRQLGGTFWVKNIHLTSSLFTLPMVIVWSIINTIAWIYGSTLALPWTMVCLLIFLWFVQAYPLCAVGAVVAKNMHSTYNFPCRTRNIRREIPKLPWYKSPLALACLGGLLQYIAMFIEVNYLFSLIWMRHSYELGGLLTFILIIQLPVTSCVSIATTYLQLSMEDYRWWWRTIITPFITGICVMVYALYFCIARTNMTGMLQIAHFLGCSFLISLLFFMALSFISFNVSLAFVKYMYRNIKLD